MDKDKYTKLTSGQIKVLIAHDGNFNHPVIERFIQVEVCDDDGNVVKTIPLSVGKHGLIFNMQTEIKDENKELLEFMADMWNFYNS